MATGVTGFLLSTEEAQAATNQQIVYNFLTDNIGFNSAAACGVMANIEAESDFNPNDKGDLKDGVYTSYGILQWHDGSSSKRLTKLKEWCKDNGYDYKTITGQLHYLKQELSANNDEWLWNGKTIYNYLENKENVPNSADGAWEAGRYWCYEYERPANKVKKSQERGDLARDTYWKEYGTGTKKTTSSGKTQTNASIKISDAVYPETVKSGTSFTIKGTVASQLKLTKVRAACLDTNGKVKTEASAKPNAVSYKLADSAVDNGLLISKLEPGKYTYILEASNTSKDAALLEKDFTVIPKGTSLKAVKAGKDQFTVSWKKQESHTDGYQIQYAVSDRFKNAKIITVKKTSTLEKTVKGLKTGTKYHVRIRTYANYDNKGKTARMTSGWSDDKSVTVK